MMEAIKIYGVSFSTFLRSVRLMCQYKGIGHEVTLAPYGEVIPCFGDRHAEIHPFRKLPVLIEGDLALPESCAIGRYLESKPGPSLFPLDAPQKARVDATANMISIYVANAVVKNVVLEFFFPKGESGQVRLDAVAEALPTARAALEWLNDMVESPRYLMAGQFTLCDALLIPMLDYLAQLPASVNFLPELPALAAYLDFQRTAPYSEGILGAADLSVLGR